MPSCLRHVLFVHLLAIAAFAGPGDLERVFGPKGTVQISFPATPSRICKCSAVLEQPDGKIVCAGFKDNLLGFTRHHADGTVDTSFGIWGSSVVLAARDTAPFELAGLGRQSDGKLIACGFWYDASTSWLMRLDSNGAPAPGFGTPFLEVEGARTLRCLAVQPDDKIVVAGLGEDMNFFAARLDRDGVLDPDFGNGGKVSISQQNTEAEATCVRLMEDGKILLCGTYWSAAGSGFMIVRLNADGSADASFGAGGVATVTIEDADECRSVAIQSDGKIVAGGTVFSSEGRKIAIARWLSNGTLDSAFGTAGKIVTTGPRTCAGITAAPDGNLVVLGHDISADNEMSCQVARYTSAGVIDTSFGQEGRAAYPIGAFGGEIIASCPGTGGRIIAAGAVNAGDAYATDFVLVCLSSSGELDQNFGGGVSTDSWGGSARVAVQPDGKILACGFKGSDSWQVMSLMRRNSDGTPDEGFGEGGRVQPDLGGGTSGASGLAVQNDGRIVVAGTRVFSGRTNFAVARFFANGTPDTSFGNGGTQQTSMGDNVAIANDMALQADGKIVVAGEVLNAGHYDFAVARYLSDGTLDTQFGTAGLVVTSIGPGDDFGTGVVLQPDGKIIVAGSFWNGTDRDVATVRYNSDGTIDSSFGTNGKATTGVGTGDDVTLDIELQPDGKLLLGGCTYQTNSYSLSKAALIRYLPDGSLDNGFGTGGKVVTQVGIGSSRIIGLALQADQRIVVVGKARVSLFYGGGGMALMRYEADGKPDSSFGIDGMGYIARNGSNASASDVAIREGTLIVLGSVTGSILGSQPETILAAYQQGPLLPLVAEGAAINITAGQATLNGVINPNGYATTARFEFGPTAALGASASLVLAPNDGTQAQNVSASLSDLSPGTTYYYRVTATNEAGTRSTAGSVFSTLTSRQGWRLQYFGTSLNTGNAADMADFDHDGLPNLLEWACGQNPVGGTPVQFPLSVRLGSADLAFTYERSLDAVSAGTVFSVQWSDDLHSDGWNGNGVNETVIFDNGILQQVQARIPAGLSGRRFVRLMVTPTP